MQKTKLTKLDTKGVAVVTAGANGKRFALAKHDTIESAFLEVLKSGDMPLDENAIEDMCMRSGLDAQATETVKAIMKLRYVYRDNAAFNGLVKQLVTQGDNDGDLDAGTGDDDVAGQAQPAKPDAPGQPGEQKPAGDKPAGDKAPPFAAKEPDPSAGSGAGQKQDAAGKAPEKDGYPPEGKQDATPPSGGDKKEPPMALTDEEKKKLEKADEAVAKAAAAEAQITELKKSNDTLKATLDAQKSAVETATQAVQKMQDDLALSRWVNKAKEELSFVSGKTPDELGKTLFDLEKLSPEMAKSQFELLKSQAAIVKSSGMFRPSGMSGAPAGTKSAWDEAKERTQELVAKSIAGGASKEAAEASAINAVFKADPALYRRYCEEQKDINRAAFN